MKATKDIMAPAFAEGSRVLTLHQLHPSRSSAPECEAKFDRIGYAPLSTYYADEEDGVNGQRCFRAYMGLVAAELATVLVQAAPRLQGQEGDTLAIWGHAVFLNAVAIAVGEAVQINDADSTIQAFDLGEAQGIVLDARAGTAALSPAP